MFFTMVQMNQICRHDLILTAFGSCRRKRRFNFDPDHAAEVFDQKSGDQRMMAFAGDRSERIFE